MDDRKKVLDFISQQKLTVISSIGPNGGPQSAVIGFGQTERFELIFGTLNTSRKYQNIKADPHVSFVIGWGNATVQYEGLAHELSEADMSLVRETYWKKNTNAERFHNDPGQRYFKVSPKWIRYSDFGAEPFEIITLDF